MEEIYVNVEYDKSCQPRPSITQTGPRSPEKRFLRAAVLCLGLLTVFLVAGLIALSVLYRNSLRDAAELVAIKANLTELLQASNDKLSSVTGERDRLNGSLADVTEERDRLSGSLADVTEERDRLHKLSNQNKLCPTGWQQFQGSSYCLADQRGSWAKGRQRCRESGANLVVIDSAAEQAFLAKFTNVYTWIGLSDLDEEGTWKWVDGSPLTMKYWAERQPDNGNGDPKFGEEDCVHIRQELTDKWNDLSCEASLPWICEKTSS